jgi:hypothetical protein
VFDLDTLYRVRDGHLDPAVVGYLAFEGLNHLRARIGAQVYLSRYSLDKNIRHHPDVDMFEYLRIPTILSEGLIITDRKDPKTVVVVYQAPELDTLRYKVAVKCAQGGHDLWVTSFHRLAPRQTKRLLNGARILKRHA